MRGRFRWLLPVALLAFASSAHSQNFTLGIVRPDGRLVPLAAYDGKHFEKAWPQADEGIDSWPPVGQEVKVPKSSEEVASIWRKRGEPVPKVWNVWPILSYESPPMLGYAPVRAVVDGSVEVVEALCSPQIALATDLPAGKTWNLGVAVDSDLPISSIVEVRRSEELWKSAEQTVASSFSRLEARQAETEQIQMPSEKPAPVATIQDLYRDPGSFDSPLYFIAEKEYRTTHVGDTNCHLITLVTGWLMPGKNGRLTLSDSTVFLTDCDGKDAPTAWPLAAFRVSDRLFWVLHEHGYEDESYSIVEIGSAKVYIRLKIDGGAC